MVNERFNVKRSISIGKRRFFDEVRKKIDDGSFAEADDVSLLREQALEAFTNELDSKLNSMRDGQYLTMMFRLEVINSDGTGVKEPSARTSPEAHEWRKRVFTRDNFTCVECGDKGRLNAHHIVPWADSEELRFDINNGVTLCLECHTAKHPEKASLIRNARYHKAVM